MSNTCPICSQTGRRIRDSVKGGNKQSVGQSVAISVYRCDSCWLDFLEIWDDGETVRKFYENEKYVFSPITDRKILKYDEYNERLQRIVPYLNTKKTLLDIGCGDGTFLRMIRPYVKEAHGVDINKKQVQNLRQEGFKIWQCQIEELKPEYPYDIICMYAILEHIPNVLEFLLTFKGEFIHSGSQLFIEVPNLMNPLVSCYDIEKFRNFYYRQYHLYYFTEKSLGKLLKKVGFKHETKPLIQASITNHFHWMHKEKGQTTTDMTNVVLPQPALMNMAPSGKRFMDLLNQVDDFYRDLMLKNGIGDLIACRAWIE